MTGSLARPTGRAAVPDDGVDHVLLTRFNLPTQGVEGLIRAREGWLHDRVQLFERYCAPSVARQTLPVTWIVYLDPQSPSWLMGRLEPLVASGLIRPIHRTSVEQEELLADIRDAVPTRGDHLLTTNLDNDDGLAIDFVERLRAAPTSASRTALYLTHGLVKHGDRVFARTDRHNAFCSVREPWQDAVTSWSEYHNELARIMPVVELDGRPAWLQVVHGANVSNRVRGRLVSPRTYAPAFPGMLDDVRVPRMTERARDTVFRLPVRAARDTGRTAVRSAGLAVLGKERYQAAKLALSRVRKTGPRAEDRSG